MVRIVLGWCLMVGFLWGCVPTDSSSDEVIDLKGNVLLIDASEGELVGVTVRLAFQGGDLVGTATTDPSGAYLFRNVPGRNMRLDFYKEGFKSATEVSAEYRDDGTFLINSGSDVVLEPDRSASLSGRLTSTLPVPWDEIATLTLKGPGEDVTLRPEADGHFAQPGLRPGLYGLNIEAEGHLPRSLFVELATDASVELDAIAMDPERGVLMRGRALLDGAEEHSGTQVRVELEGSHVANVITDAEGYFAYPASRLTYTLVVSRSNHVPTAGQEGRAQVTWVEEPAEPDGGYFEVDGAELSGRLDEAIFRMAPLPTAALRGSVAALDGLGGEQVALSDWSSRAYVTLTGEDPETQPNLIAPVVDAEMGRGQFQFSGVVPGSYTLGVTAQGFAPITTPVRLEEGENTLEELIELEPDLTSEEGQQLRGVVMQEGGEPAASLFRCDSSATPWWQRR